MRSVTIVLAIAAMLTGFSSIAGAKTVCYMTSYSIPEYQGALYRLDVSSKCKARKEGQAPVASPATYVSDQGPEQGEHRYGSGVISCLATPGQVRLNLAWYPSGPDLNNLSATFINQADFTPATVTYIPVDCKAVGLR